MISQHPDVEAKVLAELDVLELLVTPARPQPRAMTYEDTGKLVYTIWAIKVSSAGVAEAARARCMWHRQPVCDTIACRACSVCADTHSAWAAPDGA